MRVVSCWACVDADRSADDLLCRCHSSISAFQDGIFVSSPAMQVTALPPSLSQITLPRALVLSCCLAVAPPAGLHHDSAHRVHAGAHVQDLLLLHGELLADL